MDDLKQAHLNMIRAEIDLDHADYHGFSHDKIELLQEVWLACQAEYLRLKAQSEKYSVWLMRSDGTTDQKLYCFDTYCEAHNFAFDSEKVVEVEITRNGEVVYHWELGRLT